VRLLAQPLAILV